MLKKSRGFLRTFAVINIVALVTVLSITATPTNAATTSSIEAKIEAGGTIPAGNYKVTRKIVISKSNITINASGVTLDGSSLPVNGNGDIIYITGSNNKINNIKCKNAGQCGMFITGSNNTISGCATFNNRNTGIHLANGASNNTITGCTSYGNYDSIKKGEDADGFAVKAGAGSGNKFINCTAYNNSDDGWDFYGCKSVVTISGCKAYSNGRDSNGDGNGFKLGSTGVSVAHKLSNCNSYNNKGCGYTKNGNTGKISYTNCSSSGNGHSDNR
ncbi:MAG: right-handed parallel beta-helix repeat-containing protein [Bacillota bacterium]|nr:right-handed parallel beta-helix repeat-containing protein [Bacillota bacterium]